MSARAMISKPFDPELQALVDKACAWFDRLTPEQKREHCRAQRKSWVIGEMMLQHPEMSREHAEKLYEEVDR